MSEHFPKIVTEMISDIESSKPNGNDCSVYDDSEEKEIVIISLKSFSTHSGSTFEEYLGRCIDAVYKQLNQKLVRKSAIEALSQFTVTLFKLNKIERAQEAVLKLVPKFFEYDIGHDDIAMIVLQSYIDILNQMKGKALVNGKVEEMFLDSFVHVFESSLDDTEYCFTLQVLAGKVLFAFGQALSSQEFQKHFESVFKLLSEKLKKAENNDNLYSERGLIYDILSKCFDVLKQYTAKWFVKLLPSYLTDISNEKFEVCRNVIIGLGKMVLFSDNTAHHFIGDIFEKLSQIVSKGTEDGIRDHICGVIAQLILTNQTNVPIEYMMPLIIQNIPLHKEFYENKAVFKAFHKILKTKSEFFIQHLKRVICADLLTLGEKSYEDDDSREILVHFLNDAKTLYPDVFKDVCANDPKAAEYSTLLK